MYFLKAILLSFFNNGVISNIKPVLEWSDTVLPGEQI